MEDETPRNELPPFPVDETTLDLIERSITIDPDTDEVQTSLYNLLDFLSEMGGSDPTASTLVDPEEILGPEELFDGVEVRIMRDAFYSEHDLIRALIEEIRRLRSLQ